MWLYFREWTFSKSLNRCIVFSLLPCDSSPTVWCYSERVSPERSISFQLPHTTPHATSSSHRLFGSTEARCCSVVGNYYIQVNKQLWRWSLRDRTKRSKKDVKNCSSLTRLDYKRPPRRRRWRGPRRAGFTSPRPHISELIKSAKRIMQEKYSLCRTQVIGQRYRAKASPILSRERC